MRPLSNNFRMWSAVALLHIGLAAIFVTYVFANNHYADYGVDDPSTSLTYEQLFATYGLCPMLAIAFNITHISIYGSIHTLEDKVMPYWYDFPVNLLFFVMWVSIHMGWYFGWLLIGSPEDILCQTSFSLATILWLAYFCLMAVSFDGFRRHYYRAEQPLIQRAANVAVAAVQSVTAGRTQGPPRQRAPTVGFTAVRPVTLHMVAGRRDSAVSGSRPDINDNPAAPRPVRMVPRRATC